jgi:hypothetical protein
MPAHEKPLLRRTKKSKDFPTQEAMETSKAL